MRAVKEIPLRRHDGSVRAWARVSDRDYAWLSQWRWCLNGGYVGRVETHNGIRTHISMHGLILDLPHPRGDDPREGDHRDGNPLNNQRSNLRILTHKLNGQNRRDKPKTSAYRGVCWTPKDGGKWRAQVRIDGKQVQLGTFEPDEEVEAARAAALARKDLLPGALH